MEFGLGVFWGGLGGVTGSEFRVLRIHDFGVEGLSGFRSMVRSRDAFR